MKKTNALAIILLFVTTVSFAQNIINSNSMDNYGNNPNPQVQTNNINQVKVNYLNNINVSNNDGPQQAIIVNQQTIQQQTSNNTFAFNKGTSSRRSYTSVSTYSSSSSASFGTTSHHAKTKVKLTIKASPSTKRFFNENSMFHKNKAKKHAKNNKRSTKHCFGF